MNGRDANEPFRSIKRSGVPERSFIKGFSMMLLTSSKWNGTSKVFEYATRPKRTIRARWTKDLFRKSNFLTDYFSIKFARFLGFWPLLFNAFGYPAVFRGLFRETFSLVGEAQV